MGLLSKLKAGFDAATAVVGLDGEVAKLRNKGAVEASLAIVALVAGADGEVEAEERAAGVNFVRKGDLFKAFDRSALSSRLEEFYAKATDPIVKEDLFDVIKVVRGTDAARAVVKVGMGIAAADGEVEPQEKDVLREVCSLLLLDPSEFRGLTS